MIIPTISVVSVPFILVFYEYPVKLCATLFCRRVLSFMDVSTATDFSNRIIGDIECHDAEGIKECFENDVDPNGYFNNVPLIYELTSEYARTPRFKECVKAFISAGLNFEDKALLAVLSDNAFTLESVIGVDRGIISKQYTLQCAYTPLYKATLLHICAEFNHVSCAEVLIKNGANVNAKAGIDDHGFGGQTPVFHTVNQNQNNSADMMDLLVTRSADLHITVTGIIWGKGYPWETLVPAVNPISYAMMGCLPQMHRNEKKIAETVAVLLKAAYGIDYVAGNVPNRYLRQV